MIEFLIRNFISHSKDLIEIADMKYHVTIYFAQAAIADPVRSTSYGRVSSRVFSTTVTAVVALIANHI